MSGIRTRALQTAKLGLHKALRWDFAAKLATLVAQERDVARSAHAHARYHDALVAAAGQVVRRGPFAGMVYATADSAGSTLAPKLLGSYEAELHDTIAELLRPGAVPYDVVLDIGAAEGFYAVGLARGLPRARVIAYELQPHGRTLLLANAEANGVADRVEVHGACTPAAIGAVASGASGAADATRVLIVSDCEGAEYHLLDGERLPSVGALLRRSDLLLELHRDSTQTAGASPRDYWSARLAPTHHLRWIDVAGRDPAHYPELAAIPYDQRQAILFERTEDSGWLFARARAAADG